MRVFVGVDGGSGSHAVCVIDTEGPVLGRLEAGHDRAGTAVLILRLMKYRVPGHIPVAIERSSGLLVDTLVEAGFVVTPIHPDVVEACRPRYRAVSAESDPGDASILADILRTDGHRLTALKPQSDAIEAQRGPVRGRDDLVSSRVASGNQLCALPDGFWPGATVIFAELGDVRERYQSEDQLAAEAGTASAGDGPGTSAAEPPSPASPTTPNIRAPGLPPSTTAPEPKTATPPTPSESSAEPGRESAGAPGPTASRKTRPNMPAQSPFWPLSDLPVHTGSLVPPGPAPCCLRRSDEWPPGAFVPRFCRFSIADPALNGDTLRDFRVAPIRTGAFDQLSEQLDRALEEADDRPDLCRPVSAQVVDARRVVAARQCNTEDAKAAIRAAEIGPDEAARRSG